MNIDNHTYVSTYIHTYILCTSMNRIRHSEQDDSCRIRKDETEFFVTDKSIARSPHIQPVLSSAVSYPHYLLLQYLLLPVEASPPGPIALSLLPLSVEYVHPTVEKTEEKIRSTTHTDMHTDRKGRARIHATAQQAMGISDMFPRDTNHHQVETID